jgi:hypothetical protein
VAVNCTAAPFALTVAGLTLRDSSCRLLEFPAMHPAITIAAGNMQTNVRGDPFITFHPRLQV